jgi:hypothetical protein
VLGNYIGSNHAGTAVLASLVGIEDAGSGDTIGGSVLGARNVISGTSGDGELLDGTAAGELLLGNYIGLDVSGRTALANGSNGIEVLGTQQCGIQVSSAQPPPYPMFVKSVPESSRQDG